ncbi:MAG: Acetyl-coenzyme A synthetase [Cenarchaeum symbiont of Oopsacas minuta]|nr:Acetyl-coenzyme A synthetase [Cenarchaeum symbiont of Oopsacas minuta]
MHAKHMYVDMSKNDMRLDSESNYIDFWEKQAEKLHWFKKWHSVLESNPPHAAWFEGGLTNASYNALDVHQKTIFDKDALIWIAEDGHDEHITYGDLQKRVELTANALISLKVCKGDRVAIYLPMIPELVVSILACARIGAVHTVVFSGFSAPALRDRIVDSGASILITADGGYRRGKIIPLKHTADKAVKDLDSILHVLVVKRTGQTVPFGDKDMSWDVMISDVSTKCPIRHMQSSDPLFILYTSGTTGKPKGVLHGTGGYLTHVHATFGWTFNPSKDDIYFCTADIGWVTGHSYVVYGPLMHGITQIIYEGALDYPDKKRTWNILEKYGVTIFYTTPTALRMLMGYDKDAPTSYNFSSLRLLGTVGEPINPSVWRWFSSMVGSNRCKIVDTWWQTETGGIMATPLPEIEDIDAKPGSVYGQVPGVSLSVLNSSGDNVKPDTKGHLVVDRPWPGMTLGLWNDEEKFIHTYWSKYPGRYHTGDYATMDSDGHLWLHGRADDVIKVAGHRIGTAELESAIVSCDDVSESAVCSIPDEIKGESIIAFVVQVQNKTLKPLPLKERVCSTVRTMVGSIAVPTKVFIVPTLPKTRSGKIMRRLLRSIVIGEPIGDVSTLEDNDVVDLVRRAYNMQNT